MPILLLLLLLSSTATAATISSSTCTASITTGCVTSYVPNAASVSVQVTGTWVGTIVFEGGNNGVDFLPLRGYPVGGGSYTTSTTINGAWTVPTGGLAHVRTRASEWISGSATVLPQASPAPIAVDVVRAVGGTFGAVDVFGTVNAALTAETVSALGPAPCIQGEAKRLAIGTTPTPVPEDLPDGGPGSLPGRTEILIVNVGDVQDVTCRPDPGDGGLPDCDTPGWGLTLFPAGGAKTFSARDGVRVRCRACVGANIPVEYLEASCAW